MTISNEPDANASLKYLSLTDEEIARFDRALIASSEFLYELPLSSKQPEAAPPPPKLGGE